MRLARRGRGRLNDGRRHRRHGLRSDGPRNVIHWLSLRRGRRGRRGRGGRRRRRLRRWWRWRWRWWWWWWWWCFQLGGLRFRTRRRRWWHGFRRRRRFVVGARANDRNVIRTGAHDPESLLRFWRRRRLPRRFLPGLLGLLGLLRLRRRRWWRRGLGLRTGQRRPVGFVIPPRDERALLTIRFDGLGLEQFVERDWRLVPVVGLGSAKETPGETACLCGHEHGHVPRLGEELFVRFNVVRGEEPPLPRVAVIPAEQRRGHFAELLLHPLPQARHDDFGLIAVNRLAELQRLVDDGIQHPGFGIAIHVTNEETEDRLRWGALQVLLQRNDGFLLKEDRVRRAVG